MNAKMQRYTIWQGHYLKSITETWFKEAKAVVIVKSEGL